MNKMMCPHQLRYTSAQHARKPFGNVGLVAKPCVGRSVQSRASSAPSDPSLTPWSFLFDLRERETLWLDENKARLVSIVARDQLGITQEELEDRMDCLLTLVPSLRDRIASMKPSLLSGLLKAPLDQIADVIITLKELFPRADVGALLGKSPGLLLQPTANLRQCADDLRLIMKTPHVDKLVEEEPLFLNIQCLRDVLSELELLMPGKDVVGLLRSDPSWILRAQRGQKWLGQNPDQ